MTLIAHEPAIERGRTRRSLRFAALAARLEVMTGRVSKGTWVFNSAASPLGWPEPTPVDEVELKRYPGYRAAIVDENDIAGEGERSLFLQLLEHIKARGLSMTSPVEMTYEDDGRELRPASMAFLYRQHAMGSTGADGPVWVRDVAPQTSLTVGLRGAYTAENFARGVALLEDWLASQNHWRADGAPRHLGYNGPFIPAFLRYGEVVIPVTYAPSR